MSTSQSQVSALVEALATHYQNFHQANKEVAPEMSVKAAVYNATEADRLKLLAGDHDGSDSGSDASPKRSGVSLEQHFERIKRAEV